MKSKTKKNSKPIIITVAIIAVVAVIAVIITARLGKSEPANATLEQSVSATVKTESTTQEPTTTTTEPATTTTTTKPPTTTKPATTASSGAANNVEILDLVNYKYTISSDFVPKLKTLSNGMQIDERVYDDLNNMLDDARKAGYSPVISSAYRSYSYQQQLYDRKINQYIDKGYSRAEAEKRAGEWVAKPGTSEHQTGLAVDLTSVENQRLDDSQLNSKCQQWYMANCWKYGFILRYPSDKKDITKINSEPWHYRYVGKNAAKEIYDSGVCLEEYLGKA